MCTITIYETNLVKNPSNPLACPQNIIFTWPFILHQGWRYFCYFIGGLVCFLLRPNEVDDYQLKMTELEKAGAWEYLCKKEIPYWSREDMPNHGPGFVYKVLKKWTKNRISLSW